MSKIITHGATMYCSLGTEKPNLTVASQTFRRIADALVGTEGDNNGMVISLVLEFANVVPRIFLVLPSHKQGWQQTTLKDNINELLIKL